MNMNDLVIMEKKEAMEVARVGDFIHVADFYSMIDDMPTFNTGVIVENENGAYNTLMDDGSYADVEWCDTSLQEYVADWFNIWSDPDNMIMLIINREVR